MGTANWKNRTLWTADNLDVLRGLNSESVDLIYLDPPFNSNKTYEAPIGSQAAGAAFKDAWTLGDTDLAWHGEVSEQSPALYEVIKAARRAAGDGMMAYLIMMAVRLVHLRRVLKPTGSIYLHCDPTASHYLKLLLDVIYGRRFFRNEIIWSYRRWPAKQQNFQRMHDVILRYSKTASPRFNVLYEPPSESYLKRFKGKTQVLDPETGTRKLVVDKPTKGMPMRDVWALSIVAGSSRERVGYPTQKPLALLDRIIRASSNEGDTVLDPFCGCATALVAAERLGRRWVGIDISPLAVKLVKQRLQDEMGLFYDVTHRTDQPQRTDLGKLPPYGTHKHHLYGRQEGDCAGCRVHFPYKNLTVDHMVPKSKGGTDHFDNLQLLCGWCNSKKGNRSQEWLVAELARTGQRTVKSSL